MGARIAIAVALALAAVSTAATAARPRPQRFYLALGDSLTYGMQPDKASRNLPPSGFHTGYVDVVAARLRALNPRMKVVNYGCPGESTVTFTQGKCPWLADGMKLHAPFTGTQMQAALAFLRAHPRDVNPITLTLWGNDVFAAFDRCRVTLACVKSRSPQVIAAIAGHLGAILRRLRAAAPASTIVVTGAWNFDDDRLWLTNLFYRPLNREIAKAAGASSARYVDLLPSFNPKGARATRARLCAYTFICSKGDPHPTDKGYRVIAAAVLAASGFSAR